MADFINQKSKIDSGPSNNTKMAPSCQKLTKTSLHENIVSEMTSLYALEWQ